MRYEEITALLQCEKIKKTGSNHVGEVGTLMLVFKDYKLESIAFLHAEFSQDLVLDVFNEASKNWEGDVSGYEMFLNKIVFKNQEKFGLDFIEHEYGDYISELDAVKTDLVKKHYGEDCYFRIKKVRYERHFIPCGENTFKKITSQLKGGVMHSGWGTHKVPKSVKVTAPFLMTGNVTLPGKVEFIS